MKQALHIALLTLVVTLTSGCIKSSYPLFDGTDPPLGRLLPGKYEECEHQWDTQSRQFTLESCGSVTIKRTGPSTYERTAAGSTEPTYITLAPTREGLVVVQVKDGNQYNYGMTRLDDGIVKEVKVIFPTCNFSPSFIAALGRRGISFERRGEGGSCLMDGLDRSKAKAIFDTLNREEGWVPFRAYALRKVQ